MNQLGMYTLHAFTGTHLPKQGYKPQKNEQFPKYEKIVAIYYGDCIHAFKNFFRWEISENRRVFYLLLCTAGILCRDSPKNSNFDRNIWAIF